LKEDEDLETITSYIDSKCEILSSSVSDIGESVANAGNDDETLDEPLREMIQKSYKEVKAIAESFKPSDPKFERSGLVLATDGKGGKSEYVHPDVKAVCEKYGFEECIKMSPTELQQKCEEVASQDRQKKENEYENDKKKSELHTSEGAESMVIEDSNLEEEKSNEDIISSKDQHEPEKKINDSSVQNNGSEEESTSSILIEGYLEKKRSRVVGYKTQYFVLKKDGTLEYYNSKDDKLERNESVKSKGIVKRIERNPDKGNEMIFTLVKAGDDAVEKVFRPIMGDRCECEKWIRTKVVDRT